MDSNKTLNVEVVRQTSAFVLTKSEKGFRLKALETGVEPRSRSIEPKDADYLRSLGDASFNGASVLDFGVGVFKKR